mmetsp:Transcript_11740/g.15236  ORF Transcript_11740/g.15236 Transcript_11740/m.15236 type:complete len:688 (+) Transcript_11740:206-2269(+)
MRDAESNEAEGGSEQWNAEWIGSPIFNCTADKEKRTHYQGVRLGPNCYFLRDIVTVVPHYVAIIDELYQVEKNDAEKADSMKFAGRWFYCPDEIPDGILSANSGLKGVAAEGEIFYSEHCSDNSIFSIDALVLVEFIVDSSSYVFTRNYDGEGNGRLTPLNFRKLKCSRMFDYSKAVMKGFLKANQLEHLKHEADVLRLSERYQIPVPDAVLNRKSRIMINNFQLLQSNVLNGLEGTRSRNLSAGSDEVWRFDGTLKMNKKLANFPAICVLHRVVGINNEDVRFAPRKNDIILLKGEEKSWLQFARVHSVNFGTSQATLQCYGKIRQVIDFSEIITIIPHSAEQRRNPGDFVSLLISWKRPLDEEGVQVRLDAKEVVSLLTWSATEREKYFFNVKIGSNLIQIPRRLEKPETEVQLFTLIMLLLRPYAERKRCTLCYSSRLKVLSCSNFQICNTFLCSNCVEAHAFHQPWLAQKLWPFLCPKCHISAAEMGETVPTYQLDEQKSIEFSDESGRKILKRTKQSRPRLQKWKKCLVQDPEQAAITEWERSQSNLRFCSADKFLVSIRANESAQFYQKMITCLSRLNSLLEPMLKNRITRLSLTVKKADIERKQSLIDQGKTNEKLTGYEKNILRAEPSTVEDSHLFGNAVDEIILICKLISRESNTASTMKNFIEFLPPALHFIAESKE